MSRQHAPEGAERAGTRGIGGAPRGDPASLLDRLPGLRASAAADHPVRASTLCCALIAAGPHSRAGHLETEPPGRPWRTRERASRRNTATDQGAGRVAGTRLAGWRHDVREPSAPEPAPRGRERADSGDWAGRRTTRGTDQPRRIAPKEPAGPAARPNNCTAAATSGDLPEVGSPATRPVRRPRERTGPWPAWRRVAGHEPRPWGSDSLGGCPATRSSGSWLLITQELGRAAWCFGESPGTPAGLRFVFRSPVGHETNVLLFGALQTPRPGWGPRPQARGGVIRMRAGRASQYLALAGWLNQANSGPVPREHRTLTVR
jgi:hypothetical protein